MAVHFHLIQFSIQENQLSNKKKWLCCRCRSGVDSFPFMNVRILKRQKIWHEEYIRLDLSVQFPLERAKNKMGHSLLLRCVTSMFSFRTRRQSWRETWWRNIWKSKIWHTFIFTTLIFINVFVYYQWRIITIQQLSVHPSWRGGERASQIRRYETKYPADVSFQKATKSK